MLLMTILFLFLLLQSDSILSPTTIAIVTGVFTVAIGAIGVRVLQDKVHSNTRIKGFVAALLAAYGIVAPVISNLPKGVGVAIAVVGLVVTLTSGRLQGPTE